MTATDPVGTSPWWSTPAAELYVGDARTMLAQMPQASVDCIVTSPPYFGLRSYDTGYWDNADNGCPHVAQPRPGARCPNCGGTWTDGQYGQEDSLDEYLAHLVAVFDQAARVLTPTGTCWLNIGDSYASNKPRSAPPHGTTSVISGEHATRKWMVGAVAGVPAKSLIGVPWRLVLALQETGGWIIRNACLWTKTNAQPSPVRDRFATSYELVFLLTRSQRYYFDLDAVRVPVKYPRDRRRLRAGVSPDRGKNPGDVWAYPTRALRQAHFAAFPVEIPLRCIKAGCPPGGTVIDPFSGAGTTGLAALELGRHYIGIDLSAKYAAIARGRLSAHLDHPALEQPDTSSHTATANGRLDPSTTVRMDRCPQPAQPVPDPSGCATEPAPRPGREPERTTDPCPPQPRTTPVSARPHDAGDPFDHRRTAGSPTGRSDPAGHR